MRREMVHWGLSLILIGIPVLSQVVVAQEVPPAKPNHLGIGWAGVGAGFRYWTDGPWGFQAGGLITNTGEDYGEQGYSRRRYVSGGANLMYRLVQAGKTPITYLALNVGGEYTRDEGRWCDEEGVCHDRLDQHTTVGAMALGGMEFFLFNRFGLSAEVGLRYSQTDGRPSLWPGFGVALLFYLF